MVGKCGETTIVEILLERSGVCHFWIGTATVVVTGNISGRGIYVLQRASERERQRQRQTETDRQTDRQRHKNTETQRQR